MLGTVSVFLGSLVYANFGEWFIHKYVLHGLGKSKDSMWSFHWRGHHNACRKHDMIDPAYGPLDPVEDTHGPYAGLTAREKEALGLATIAVVHAPLLALSMTFVLGVWLSIIAYYYVHARSHREPGWAQKWLPWHRDHHVLKNQDQNWCVTFPLADWVMGTRKKS
jgi:hypothetical protein